MNIRVRYAPSPTGNQHIGGIRTALFNYLFARSKNGKFILRLEDTDQTRCEKKYEKNLYDTFEWLKFNWDEGPDKGGSFAPYVQSERSDLYKKYAMELIEKDKAYFCFCTSERIDEVRKQREAAHSSESGYDRLCRTIPAKEAADRARAGEACTIRLKIPLEKQGDKEPVTEFFDHILGNIVWKNSDINPDPVLLKSDGFPTYHLANVVDDHLMDISHVMRAQEWIPSVPLHVIMYRAFGWDHPEYCHLPMVMGTDGKKLSKRHGSTSIDEFRYNGYLPEALINYIAMVGCSYEEGKDIYTLPELAERFDMAKLNKAPAIFDYKKLEWFNGQYIRMKDDKDLFDLCLPIAIEQGLFSIDYKTEKKPGQKPNAEQEKLFLAAIPLVKERAVFLSEIPDKLTYVFKEPDFPDKHEFIPKKADIAAAIELLKKGRELTLSLATAPNDEEAETMTKAFAEEHGLKLGDLMMPLRVAITGARVSPPLFGSLRLLGNEKALGRIDRALEYLQQ